MTIRLERALAYPDPAFSFLFRVLNLECPVELGFDLDYVHAISIPIPFIESNGLYRSASRTYYPGISDVNAVSVTFFEDHRYRVHKWLNRWRSLVRDPKTGCYEMPVNHKGKMTIVAYGPQESAPRPGSEPELVEVIKYELVGLFPTSQPPTDFTYSSGDRIQVQMEFSVDDMQIIE